MSDSKTGLNAALEASELGSQARADGKSESDSQGAGLQLDLLSEEAKAEDEAQRVFSAGKRGPGRPKGSTNRKTKAIASYLAARGYKDPLVFLADMVTANPGDLREWLVEQNGPADANGGVNILDVIKLQLSAAKELAPYIHGKKPIEIDLKDDRLPTLILDLGTNQLDEARQGDRDALSVGLPLASDAGEESE